uniref:G-protein coupled receptors family 2 profile 2 domain-containing protein n=1 Tax=Amphimedon queenslandica TaxID=400682 RepID=A0A1X7UPV4_AMPQE
MGNCSNLTPEDQQVIGLTGAITSSISLISCLLVILMMIVYKKYTFTTQRLILYLTISVMFDSIAHILQGGSFGIISNHSKYCMAIAFLRQYFAWSIILSIDCILMEMALRIICRRESGKGEWLYIPFIFVFPLFFAWIPLLKHDYGDIQGTCNFLTINPGTCTRNRTGLILDVVLWWVPLYLTFFVGAIVYLIIICQLNISKRRYTAMLELDKEVIYKRTMNDIGYFKWYPLLYFIINLIPIAAATTSYIRPNDDLLALNIPSTIIVGLQGGFIALAAALDPSTRKRLGWRSFCSAFKENVLCRDTAEEYPILEGNFTDSLNLSETHRIMPTYNE